MGSSGVSPSSPRNRVLMFISLLTLTFAPAVLTLASNEFSKNFKLDLDEQEEESGERLQLHSQGSLAETIDLDLIPQVKRVACAGNRLMLAMTDSTVAHGWKVGQLVVGGPQWGCNVTWGHSRPGVRIFVKIDKMVFPVEGRPEVSPVDMVTIHHVPAGPLDMLREASIFFRFQPASSPLDGASRVQRSLDEREAHSERLTRFRRSLYNLVTNLVDNVDWHANFSTTLPFDVGVDSSNVSAETLAIHKSWGEKELNMTRGLSEARAVSDDFILFLDRLTGESRMAYTFDLVIKNVNGTPKVVRYISQFDVNTDISTDATVTFNREIGMTYSNTTVWQSPSWELLRMPVAQSFGLPPIYLVVSAQSVVQASVRAYSSGAAVLRTAYNASGFVTLSQQFDPTLSKASAVTSRGWTARALEQTLDSPYRTEVDFSLYQTLKFQPSIAWHYHDVDMELAPPSEMTLKPTVTLRSSRPGVARCLQSSLSLDAHVTANQSRFAVKAFGLQIWDVPLQPALSRDLRVLDTQLKEQCAARCDGPSQLNKPMSRFSSGTIVRGDATFNRLSAVGGDYVRFYEAGGAASWCGRTGLPCFSCSSHAYDTPKARSCASRLMTSRLASSVSHLAELVAAEWPDRRVLVVEAWDEPTSQNPSGTHPNTSLFKEGRAAVLKLTSTFSPSTTPMTLTSADRERLGELAVCSGMEHVVVMSGQAGLEVAVVEDGHHVQPGQLDRQELDDRTQFGLALANMDVTQLYAQCTTTAPYLAAGSSWPDVPGGPQDVCGPTVFPLDRADRKHMDRLVQYTHEENTVTFEPEGQPSRWCGVPTRPCLNCVTSSSSSEPWDWCSTRMMTPRLALRFRTLQKLAQSAGFGIRVLRAFSEPNQAIVNSTDIFNEGRALELTTVPAGSENSLSSFAVCAGFDFVQHSSNGHVTVYVQSQHGYRANSMEYLEGSSHLIVSPERLLDSLEFELPTPELAGEGDIPPLVDGGFNPEVALSEHVTVGDVMSRDSRYFRFDELLLTCFELVLEDFKDKVEILKDYAYLTRAANFLNNMDLRHDEERWRHMTGQALRLRPLNQASLLKLATSIMRECPTLAQPALRAVGIGCHDDHIYLDLRPMEEDSGVNLFVWDTETSYCAFVSYLQLSLLTGGPVIQSEPSVTCVDNGLDPGLEFISAQFGQQDLCQIADQGKFCQLSQAAREKAADDLQEVLTAAAGHGRLPRYDIIYDIRACLVNTCGGCPESGPIFDAKVRACSRVVHKYLESAAAPFPDLKNVTTFFNADTEESVVHGEACRAGKVCVEETIIYSLLVPTVTKRFYPNPAQSLEREMFSSAINPTPLLDLAAQELAYRARGIVEVYVQDERDVYSLHNVLKVLFTYNSLVTLVEIHVAPGVDIDLVTSSIQRKLTTWAGVACPEHSRFAIAPFTISQMSVGRGKRSAERSAARNEAKAALYNWERDWLDSML